MNIHAFAMTAILHLAAAVPAGSSPGNPACRECDDVVRRVVPLLPERPPRIVVIDVDIQPRAFQQRLENVESFVIAGEPTIYLKKQGWAFCHARERAGIWDYVLASFIWHEMAHVAGANEMEARRRQEALWKQFITSRRVDSTRGLAYLEALQNRH